MLIQNGHELSTVLARPGQTQDEPVRNADLALYKAKAEGRRSWRIFEEPMNMQPAFHRAIA